MVCVKQDHQIDERMKTSTTLLSTTESTWDSQALNLSPQSIACPRTAMRTSEATKIKHDSPREEALCSPSLGEHREKKKTCFAPVWRRALEPLRKRRPEAGKSGNGNARRLVQRGSKLKRDAPRLSAACACEQRTAATQKHVGSRRFVLMLLPPARRPRQRGASPSAASMRCPWPQSPTLPPPCR